jgi:hypothetical protein
MASLADMALLEKLQFGLAGHGLSSLVFELYGRTKDK